MATTTVALKPLPKWSKGALIVLAELEEAPHLESSSRPQTSGIVDLAGSTRTLFDVQE
jgi:hypothetical protein